MADEEIWVDIPKYEGYYKISNLGNVKSIDRKIAHPRAIGGYVIKKGKILNQIQGCKLKIVRLYKDTIAENYTLNRLVYEVFSKTKLADKLYCHPIDNNIKNNAFDNIRISKIPFERKRT